MASISKTKNGAVRIRFTLDQKCLEIYLGKVSERFADDFCYHVGAFVVALETSTSLPHKSHTWASDLAVKYQQKLSNAGLVDLQAPEVCPSLSNFVDTYICNRTDVKESSRSVYRRARNCLVEFFGDDRTIDSITRGDADDWRRHLLNVLGDNTIRKMCGVAKQIFTYAVRKKIIDENPFIDLPTAVGARAKEFVNVVTIQRLINMAPDSEWRLVLALARYGGLRVPSEPLALTWGDVDFQNGMIHVRQPKVEHHAGKATRTMPLFPSLRPYLEDVFNSRGQVAPEDNVLKSCRLTNYNTQLGRIARKAGVQLGDAFFTSCRSSRETELMNEYPAHVVCAWIGNSEAVARKHYLQVTDDHLAKALNETPEMTPETSEHQVTTLDSSDHVKREKTTESSGLPTKNGVPGKCLVTPLNRPNWTRTSDLHDVNVAL